MVGNKAQKAVAAALTGMMVLGSAAPAFAGTQINAKWSRLDGKYTSTVTTTTTIAENGVVDPKKTKTNTEIVTSGGVDRYDTMFELVKKGLDDEKWTGDDIVLVAGDAYADALSASGLAGALSAPIVSTPGNELGKQAKDIIADLIAARDKETNEAATGTEEPTPGDGITVHIVGGTAAVSAEVEEAVRALSIASHVKTDKDGKEVKDGDKYVYAPAQPVRVLRVAGSDRTETSMKVMQEIDKYVGKDENTGDEASVFVANGWAPYDALSVSWFAYGVDAPILLTSSDGHLTDDQLDYLKDDYSDTLKMKDVELGVVGGPASSALQDVKDAKIPFAYEHLLSGADRYETSKLVIQRYGAIFENVVVATGENFADALVGAPFAVVNDAVLALVGDAEKTTNWDVAIQAAVSNGAQKGFILGGTGAVNKSTEDRLVRYI